MLDILYPSYRIHMYLVTLFHMVVGLFRYVQRTIGPLDSALCSRNFQNVKLRLGFVDIWSFYRHSDFTWNPILANSNGPKMLILTILKGLNFYFSKFELLSNLKFTKNSKFRVSKIAKNDIFGPYAKFHVKSEWR